MELPEEYKEYIRQTTGFVERATDALTAMDERMNYVVMQLAAGLSPELVGVLTASMSELKTTLEMQMAIGRTEEVPLQQLLPPLVGMRIQAPAPFHGYIKKVLRHWPPGCGGLVGVAVGHSGTQFLPNTGFVSLDAATPVFDNLHIEVGEGEMLWSDMQNGDAANAHNITVTITLTEIK